MLASLATLLLLGSVAAWNQSPCIIPRVRKEWRTLGALEKIAYLGAVKCLHSKPSKLSGTFATTSRYDDFVASHIWATTAPGDASDAFVTGPGIHFNGVFLPWHRYFLWTYENALRDECGYLGAQPYWDWSRDVSENGALFDKSPVWDPILGFGGNGINGSIPYPSTFDPYAAPLGSCISNGPFAGIQNPLGYGYNLNVSKPHCINRNFQTEIANECLAWKANVQPLLNLPDFENFTISMSPIPGDPRFTTGCIFGVHGGGHFAVGSEMLNTWSSINDPIFLMHHAQLDRIWSLWQSSKPANLYAIGGPIYPNGTGITTLDYGVTLLDALAPTVPIRKLMDTFNKNGEGLLCYKYEESIVPIS